MRKFIIRLLACTLTTLTPSPIAMLAAASLSLELTAFQNLRKLVLVLLGLTQVPANTSLESGEKQTLLDS